MQHVTIVGAGLAGMTAALRLLERDFTVTLYDQDQFVGGMMRSYWDETTQTRREHSYHMFPNFYFNFWTIAEELGLEDNFTPREAFRFLRGHDLENLPALFNPGGLQQLLRNLSSYAVPPPDLFVYLYAMIDLLAEGPERDETLQKVSVNGFLQSRPYMTDIAADLHQTLWETVWAIASYEASSQAYRTFVRYSNRYSVPQLWLLAGSKWDKLLKPWLDRLNSYGEDRFTFVPGHELVEVVPDDTTRRISKLKFKLYDRDSPSVDAHAKPVQKNGRDVIHEVDVSRDEVVISVTPGALADVVKGGLYDAAPSLGQVQYLKAEPMGALQLYLNCTIENITDDVTNFEDAPYYMTFLDYTQLWADEPNTFLYVTCSDVISLLSIEAERRNKETKELELDLKSPKTAIDFVLREVLARMPIRPEQIDLRRTAFDMNTGEELFANMVGSWNYRPEAKTEIDNLWLAGTFVRNWLDVATIEGAVVTGLQAAEGIRKRHNVGTREIPILKPQQFPREMYQAMKVAWAPLAASAKLWSMSNKFMSRYGPAWEKAQEKFIRGAAKVALPLFEPMPDPPEYLGRLNWTNSVLDLPEDDPMRVGPLYWNYNPDGTLKKSARFQRSTMQQSDRGASRRAAAEAPLSSEEFAAEMEGLLDGGGDVESTTAPAQSGGLGKVTGAAQKAPGTKGPAQGPKTDKPTPRKTGTRRRKKSD